MSVTAHRTSTAGARTAVISTAEIKARLAAMFANEPSEDPVPRSGAMSTHPD
ncbi:MULTISPECIES: hypothetical protein [unclassified Rhodococcus (in: high G+C Gram-positive bacteria)]|uniref:hypothetical protein n=1 Tax=unclassified Rhodococcus (in: high G+C Gram-positive bacteria) TaxID=192944 RepID=UPI0016394DAF|nr:MULTISPECIES: hypothetical protein [unclassified Rhodococcus (in: high G+C Gram-positive bacteria)]MBC2644459.1 hypothetical protein [Rhodococcus sp. 3A]MBC2897853.1 hypothetical protein [Rhodococcus sp. 4CII]